MPCIDERGVGCGRRRHAAVAHAEWALARALGVSGAEQLDAVECQALTPTEREYETFDEEEPKGTCAGHDERFQEAATWEP